MSAAADRPLFPPDRDIEDHVYCMIEFPAPGYDAKDPFASRKKIGVQYASINGNGFGGYGEIVFGTKGTLVLEREQDLSIIKGPIRPSSVKVSGGRRRPDARHPGQRCADVAAAKSRRRSRRSAAATPRSWSTGRGASAIRAPENQPRCGPKVAMGDAVIALTANMAAREGRRIEFKKEWFDIDSDETPEGIAPDLSRYKA